MQTVDPTPQCSTRTVSGPAVSTEHTKVQARPQQDVPNRTRTMQTVDPTPQCSTRTVSGPAVSTEHTKVQARPQQDVPNPHPFRTPSTNMQQSAATTAAAVLTNARVRLIQQDVRTPHPVPTPSTNMQQSAATTAAVALTSCGQIGAVWRCVVITLAA